MWTTAAVGGDGSASVIASDLVPELGRDRDCRRPAARTSVRHVLVAPEVTLTPWIQYLPHLNIRAVCYRPRAVATPNFQLFSGVAPRRFARLFEKRTDLKDKGGIFQGSSPEVRHQDPILIKTFQDFEKDIAARINEIEATASQQPSTPGNAQ
jgi:hypothetical protein